MLKIGVGAYFRENVVNEVTVTAWQERLVALVRGYSPEDIWNENKTGCFFRALPDKILADTK